MSTAEHHIPLGHSRLAPASRRLGRATTTGVERLVLVLGICLPVPVFAATGLSVPLPSAVERIAAALVPWAEAGILSEQVIERGAAGSIVFTPDEPRRGGEAAALDPASATPQVQPKKGPTTPAGRRPMTQAHPGRTTVVATATSTDTERMQAERRAAEPDQVPQGTAASGAARSDAPEPQPESGVDQPKPGKDVKPKLAIVPSLAPTDPAAPAPTQEATLDNVKETGKPVVEQAKTVATFAEEAKAKKTVDTVTGG